MARKPKSEFTPQQLPAHLARLIDIAELTQEDNPTGMKVRFHTGDRAEANEVIALGDNASGKSLLRQLAFAHYHQAATKAEKRFEGIHISMATRAGGGMRSSFMYDPWTDSEQSTGVMSLSPLNAAVL